jgi:branched-chain amino acid transport system permease protein
MGWGLDLANEQTFYAVTCVCTVVVMVGLARVLNSRFGHVLQGIRDNESRMQALGYAVYRYKWVAFVMAGALAGLAGALLANLGGFVSPSIMQWSQSGMLLMMVILGGVGHLWGGVWGAVVFLLLEEVLSSFTIHWQLGLGALLLAVVLLAPKGLAALWQRARGGA